MTGNSKVKIGVAVVAALIRGSGKNYITVKEVSGLLGVSTRTAGRILAILEKEGYVERYSRTAYRVVHESRLNAHRASLAAHSAATSQMMAIKA